MQPHLKCHQYIGNNKHVASYFNTSFFSELFYNKNPHAATQQPDINEPEIIPIFHIIDGEKKNIKDKAIKKG